MSEFNLGDRVKSKISGRLGTIIAEPGDCGALVQFDDNLSAAAEFSRATSMCFTDIERVEEEPVNYSLQRVAEDLGISELELRDQLNGARAIYNNHPHRGGVNDYMAVEEAMLGLLTGLLKNLVFLQGQASPSLWEAIGISTELRVRYAQHPTWENFHRWRESLNPVIAAAEDYGIDPYAYDHQMPVVMNAISELIRPI